MIYIKAARTVTLILAIIAEVVCCLALNGMGAIAFIAHEYEKCGYALIISSLLLIAALITAIFKKALLPLILDFFGSAAYIYTLSVLSAIPDTKIPRENVEKLMANHYPTIAVTVLLVILVFFNFFSKACMLKLI